MSKVTVHEAPAGGEPPSGPREVTVVDSRGRKIGVRKISPSQRMRLAKVIGADGAQNQMYAGYATLAYAVTAINGEPVFPPGTEEELEAVVDRLDDEGLEAVARAYVEHFGVKPFNEDDKAAVKN